MDITMVKIEAKFLPIKEEDDKTQVNVKLEERELSVLPNAPTENMEVDPPGAPEILKLDVKQFNPVAHEAMNRQRLFLEAVEVPTLRSIFGWRLKRLPGSLTIKEIDEKLKSLDNPLVKKKEGLIFSLDTIRDRMLAIGIDPFPVSLDRSIRDVDISRLFLSHEYGGSPQDTFPSIRKAKLEEHGLDDFMCLNLDFNPCAPATPGAPGLFFETHWGPTGPWPKIQRVICRLSAGQWLYQGQYRLAPSESLTKEEWAQESQRVRNTWVKEIYRKEWGLDVKARISLRKRLGRTFTEQELQDEYDSDREYKDVTLEDIRDALLNGEETIGVWTMKCVSYDIAFQTNLATKFPTWVPPPLKEKKKKPGTSKKPASTPQKKRKHTKSKVEAESESESSDENIVLPDKLFDVSDQEELPYTPQGTRSRPIEL